MQDPFASEKNCELDETLRNIEFMQPRVVSASVIHADAASSDDGSPH